MSGVVNVGGGESRGGECRTILSNPGTSLVPGFDKIAYTAAGVKPRNVLLQKSENLCSYKTGFPNIF